jgi:hypothetical protein
MTSHMLTPLRVLRSARYAAAGSAGRRWLRRIATDPAESVTGADGGQASRRCGTDRPIAALRLPAVPITRWCPTCRADRTPQVSLRLAAALRAPARSACSPRLTASRGAGAAVTEARRHPATAIA